MAVLRFKALLQHLQAGEGPAIQTIANQLDLQKTRGPQCLMPRESYDQPCSRAPWQRQVQECIPLPSAGDPLPISCSSWLRSLSALHPWQSRGACSPMALSSLLLLAMLLPATHSLGTDVKLWSTQSIPTICFLFFWCMPDGRYHFPDLAPGLASPHTDPFQSGCKCSPSPGFPKHIPGSISLKKLLSL